MEKGSNKVLVRERKKKGGGGIALCDANPYRKSLRNKEGKGPNSKDRSRKEEGRSRIQGEPEKL